MFSSYCASCHGTGRGSAAEASVGTPAAAKCYGDSGQPGAYAGKGYRYDYDTKTYPRLGKAEKLSEIGTDRGRWASYTQNYAAAQNLLYAGYRWRFKHFRKTGGYANHPLDGIWPRSPYLHNGSVPTLRDLLEPAARRPALWYCGSELFDFHKVGDRSDGQGMSAAALFEYDTSKTGNSNAGHEGARYGTKLAASDKDALVEYMKTL